MTGLNKGYTVRRALDARDAGQTLLAVLLGRFEHADEATWRARIAAGEVRLDGEPSRPDTVLGPQRELTWAKPPWREPEAPLHWRLLFEDQHLLAVDKPSGLPTLPGAGYQEHTLLALVRTHAPGASPMHRLGRGTSGVVLFTKTTDAAQAVQALWRHPGAVQKRYLALVRGCPTRDRFSVTAPIGPVPDPVLGRLHCATPEGKTSLSHFEVLQRRATESVVAVDIETGRPHQIRIHAAVAGHPLVGDPLYGPGGGRAEGSHAVPGDLGYTLHAWRLALTHPVGGGPLIVTAPAPAVLEASGP